MWQGRSIGPSLLIDHSLSLSLCVFLDPPVFKSNWRRKKGRSVNDEQNGGVHTEGALWCRHGLEISRMTPSSLQFVGCHSLFLLLLYCTGVGQGRRKLRTCQLFVCAIACLCEDVREQSRERQGAIGLSYWLVGWQVYLDWSFVFVFRDNSIEQNGFVCEYRGQSNRSRSECGSTHPLSLIAMESTKKKREKSHLLRINTPFTKHVILFTFIFTFLLLSLALVKFPFQS